MCTWTGENDDLHEPEKKVLKPAYIGFCLPSQKKNQLEWSFVANNIIALAKQEQHRMRGPAILLSIDSDNSAWFKQCQATTVDQFCNSSEIPCLTHIPYPYYGLLFQRPFQEPKLEVPTIYKAYVRAM